MTSAVHHDLPVTDGNMVNGQTHRTGTVVPQTSDIEEALRNPSYPTNSLNFLKTPKPSGHTDADQPAPARPAKIRLRVLVIGAGLGGLATAIALARAGHEVEVLEAAPALGEVGAGIQIPPNSSRILLEWGLGPFMGEKVAEPHDITFRRWQDGAAIALTKLIPDFRQRYHAPYYVVHRAHFHEAMYQLALELGVKVKVGHKVDKYDVDTASVTIEDGRVLSGDLIVAADGVKSLARMCIPGGETYQPQATGFAAYRAAVDMEKMKADPDTAWLTEKSALHLWVGPDQHVMTYAIAGGKSFNMVLSHRDATDPSTWRYDTTIADMRRYFQGWDPTLVKIIHMIDKTMKWPLMSVPTMSRWVSDNSKFVVLGDAAHAMLPYMSQGAAMAVEDGAALACALSHADSVDELPRVLGAFERVRATRSGQMQQASFINGKLWHFADGPDQEARDLASQPETLGLPFEESSNQWSDPVTQRWAYAYDAVQEMTDALA